MWSGPQGESMGDLVMQKLQEKQVVMVKTKRHGTAEINEMIRRQNTEWKFKQHFRRELVKSEQWWNDKILWISMVIP